MAKKKSELVETEEMVNHRNITRYSKGSFFKVKFLYRKRELERTFGYKSGDFKSEQLALKEAIKFRDDYYIRSTTNKTGYINVNLDKVGDKFRIYTNFKHKKKPYSSEIYELSEDLSYTDALRLVIDYLCEIKGIVKPEILITEYGLYKLYELGYKGHPKDTEVVTKLKSIGDPIIDPETGDKGEIIGFVDEVTIEAAFKVGKPFRHIVDDVLALSIMDKRVVLLGNQWEAHNKLKNVDKLDISEEIKSNIAIIDSVHRHSNNNESITSDVKTMTSKLDTFRTKLLNVK